MNWSEIVIGLLLAGVVLALAGYFGAQQLASLRRLRLNDSMPEVERRFERRKAWRRLVSCGLMLLLAGLLGGLQFSAVRAQELADKRAELTPEEAANMTAEEKFFIRAYTGSWIALMVVLMIVLGLAGIDQWATRRYGLRQYRKLADDRRAMIQRQANRMRRS